MTKPVRLSRRFLDAIAYASRLEARQPRGGTAGVSMGHLLGTASIALAYGADEDEAIAAILHHAVRDRGGRALEREIRGRFGRKVARVVRACSDDGGVRVRKARWRAHKTAHLMRLLGADRSTVVVAGADTLHAGQMILADLRTGGPAAWDHVQGRRGGSLWYHRAILDVLRTHRLTPVGLVNELDHVVSEIERLALELTPETERGAANSGAAAPGALASEALASEAMASEAQRPQMPPREAATQPRQTQPPPRMEAIAKLAGGVAHDFNNLLTAIRGFAELLLGDLPEDDPHRHDVLQIDRAAERGAQLTQQLLAFSRRQVTHPLPFDMGEVVTASIPMLRRLVGDRVEIQVDICPDLPTVLADRDLFGQVLLNLAANARDAMPDGGLLRLAVATTRLDDMFVQGHPGATPGRHVRLTVSDTGIGMDAATLAHLFEPFFTTKEPGKGTGLGLASVYGIVKQAGGSIYADSEVGRGTTLEIYLPAFGGPDSENADDVPERRPRPAGSESILLAEDDDAVRIFAQRTLEHRGYQVHAFANPVEALAFATSNADGFDALVTDVVMPEMSGTALADRVQRLQAGIPVLLITGHDAGRLQGRSEAWLAKPFTGPQLLLAVGELFVRSS